MRLDSGFIDVLKRFFVTRTGSSTIEGTLSPASDGAASLGEPHRRYEEIHANRIFGSVSVPHGRLDGLKVDNSHPASAINVDISSFSGILASAGDAAQDMFDELDALKFTTLPDTPSSYTGSASKILRVNSSANAVEFATPTWLSLSGGTMNGHVYFLDNYYARFGTSDTLDVYNNGTDAYLKNSGGHIYIENDATDKDIIFKVNDGGSDVTLLYLDASVSRVGILTSSPNYALDVNGNAQVRENALIGYVDTSSGGLYLTKASTYTKPAVQSVTSAFGVDVLLLNPAGGNVVVGSTTAPGDKLHVDGDINSTGTIKIDSVKVIGNRVIDARIDDTISTSSWTTTNAGVLTAIRDALVTHGLIAAA